MLDGIEASGNLFDRMPDYDAARTVVVNSSLSDANKSFLFDMIRRDEGQQHFLAVTVRD